MIHSARLTVSPVANMVFTWNLFRFEKWGRTDGQSDDMCKNNDHYRPWLWVGLVDQYIFVRNLYVVYEELPFWTFLLFNSGVYYN